MTDAEMRRTGLDVTPRKALRAVRRSDASRRLSPFVSNRSTTAVACGPSPDGTEALFCAPPSRAGSRAAIVRARIDRRMALCRIQVCASHRDALNAFDTV